MIKRKFKNFLRAILLYKVFRHWIVLNMISYKIKPSILNFCGAKIGVNSYFGNGIYVDNNLSFLSIGDNFKAGPNIQFLFHHRDMKVYKKGFSNQDLKLIRLETIIGHGVSIGMGSIILPGVKIGDGAVIGAGTLVHKDVPEWTLAVGNPMRIIKEYEI
ncbi:acyltransferase [Aequorivita capsosiphonis]|uniref:acyltransferase n=1 Tax=Aequorivita capsosiphonis TaxID=487317 RepID=UPI000685BC78|nr:DapH/DapD/GlmU-related protein [Aequorivita capsosiphonis]